MTAETQDVCGASICYVTMTSLFWDENRFSLCALRPHMPVPCLHVPHDGSCVPPRL